jgi:DNA-binding NtrC family response regulator
LDNGELEKRLNLLLRACQQANSAPDPRPVLGLVTREVAALASLCEPARIVGESARLRAVRRTIESIRASSVCVLITGEQGTGKELVARTIHRTSLLARGPFLVLGRSAAHGGLPDLFSRARGGSLFLPEVCALDTAAQGEVLRCLDDPESDVRCLAASTHDLDAETALGAFRRDLYYRLKVIHLALPPLREIPEDIPLLAAHFLRRCCAEFGRDPAEFVPAPAGGMSSRPWPGNTGQLEAEIRLLVRGTLKQTVAKVEKQMIEEALEAAHGNQCQASKALGLSRQGLINKMNRYRRTLTQKSN